MEEKKIIKSRVLFKHELEKNWNQSAYVPEKGEQVFYDAETGNGDLPTGRTEPIKNVRIKVGDGIKAVKDLPFVGDDVKTKAENAYEKAIEAYEKANQPSLPAVSSANNGQFLRVVNGQWAATTVISAEEVAF